MFHVLLFTVSGTLFGCYGFFLLKILLRHRNNKNFKSLIISSAIATLVIGIYLPPTLHRMFLLGLEGDTGMAAASYISFVIPALLSFIILSQLLIPRTPKK